MINYLTCDLGVFPLNYPLRPCHMFITAITGIHQRATTPLATTLHLHFAIYLQNKFYIYNSISLFLHKTLLAPLLCSNYLWLRISRNNLNFCPRNDGKKAGMVVSRSDGLRLSLIKNTTIVKKTKWNLLSLEWLKEGGLGSFTECWVTPGWKDHMSYVRLESRGREGVGWI